MFLNLEYHLWNLLAFEFLQRSEELEQVAVQRPKAEHVAFAARGACVNHAR